MHRYICAGDRVTLVSGYDQFHDAARGPLKPGDVGLIISCDIHSGVIRARVAVSGRTWYYDKRALRLAPANSASTSSTMSTQGAAGYSAGAEPANMYPNNAAFAGAPPPGAVAAFGAPAAASPGAGGITFGAGPAAGSSSPAGAAVADGAPAAASLGAGGFSFGAGPAAGSPSPAGAVAAFGAPASASPGAGGFSFGAGAAAGSPSPAGAAAAIGASTAAAKPTAVRFSFLVYIFVLLLLVPSFFLMYISFQQCIFFRMIFKYVIVPAVSLSLFIFVEEYLSLFGVDWRVILNRRKQRQSCLTPFRRATRNSSRHASPTVPTPVEGRR